MSSLTILVDIATTILWLVIKPKQKAEIALLTELSLPKSIQKKNLFFLLYSAEEKIFFSNTFASVRI